MSEDQINRYSEIFRYPELFYQDYENHNTFGIKYDPKEFPYYDDGYKFDYMNSDELNARIAKEDQFLKEREKRNMMGLEGTPLFRKMTEKTEENIERENNESPEL